MAPIILNCDLGEDESLEQTEQLLALIDAANIGCGFHAGSPEKTGASIELALKHKLRIGAHPGLPHAGGRGHILPTAKEFQHLLEQQFSSFQATAHALGTRAEYIKLHGSLYHAVETQPDLSAVYIHFLRQQVQPVAIFALAGGEFAQAAEAAGLSVVHEAFADRDYLPDGSLVPRVEQGAVLSQSEALERLASWQKNGKIPTRGGVPISLAADTLCVHGDSPDALELIRNIRTFLETHKIECSRSRFS
ncbi:5-oxoprolinase subunit PxpA [Coraliomargarita algicola]|uniref:5-oxoprolinase subunit PxpA n=1 Tax=Coraliomargarita algicola TaxID=3092156 RepID=A0ABZ0RJI8_9BACT|nr:5-oxoprolinase subunit PxpA [Coraliomargarita sp. J2-16]WPJ96374.1 5-oxoprolinase subunit PxpA [Coraliomargarita sp. J2-16]